MRSGSRYANKKVSWTDQVDPRRSLFTNCVCGKVYCECCKTHRRSSTNGEVKKNLTGLMDIYEDKTKKLQDKINLCKEENVRASSGERLSFQVKRHSMDSVKTPKRMSASVMECRSKTPSRLDNKLTSALSKDKCKGI